MLTARQLGPNGARMATVHETICTRLFKIADAIRVNVCRVALSLSSVYPLLELFLRVVENMQAAIVAQASPG